MVDETPSPVLYPEDLELTRRALAGEEQALEAFARRVACAPRMVTAAARRMGARFSAEQAMDLAQNVLLLVWRKLDSYEGRAKLESWMFRFVFLEIRNAVRQRDRERAMEATSLDEVAAEKPETIHSDTYAVVMQALDALKPPAPEVVHLRHHEQLTFDEIGERLGVPGNTAKTIYHRALARLQGQLAARLPEELS